MRGEIVVHCETASWGQNAPFNSQCWTSYGGASEAINRLFVNDMLAEHPNLTYANREEDLGDPGLRQVKRAYNPVMMIDRYEMIAE